ncbi:hypothetical protein [Actinoplanes sp. HUAS TT8]|uniref:hypothetical protein n=1 Tax=Actinoplanes sp. HUAS TT8 TaxID=3447453 RepID=UPI003F52096B
MLTVLVLLPAAGLFLRVLQENSKQRDNVQLEQDGVEYLNALSPLISALAESQSSALQGVAAEPASVTAAVARVQGVDDRFGQELGARTRWTDLKAKIAALPKIKGTDDKVFTAHVEVADLTIALFTTVQENSTLSRDPDADISFLQSVVADKMPRAVTAVSRMSDLANMAAAATGSAKTTLNTKFGYQALLVQDSVGDLTDRLQEAVDDTSSNTLSGNLVSNLDSFRRGIEAANRGANLGSTKGPNVSTLVTAQSTLQTALSALSGVILKEISGLLDDRSGSLTYKRIEAFVLFGIAIVLIVVATLWTRGRAREVQTGFTEQPGETSRDVSVQVSGGGNAPVGNPYGGGPYDSVPNYGEAPNYGGGRERSGALR